MQIKTSLTVEDILALNAYLRKHSETYFIWKLAVFVLITPTFPAITVLLNLDKPQSLVTNAFIGLAISAAFLVTLYFLTPLIAEYRIRLLFSNPQNRKLLGDFEYQIDEVALHVKGDGIESKTAWRYIQKIRKSDDQGLLFIAKNIAHIIPKRCLTPEEFEQFMAKAQEYWLAANPPTQLPTTIAGQR